MLEEVKKSLESSPIVKKGEYNYFVNPISDGVPAMNPLMLRELALAVHKYADLDVDKIVAVEAMIFTGISSLQQISVIAAS